MKISRRPAALLAASMLLVGVAVPAWLLAGSQGRLSSAVVPPTASSMPPLKCRDDLATRAQVMGLTGIAAEIGVRDGLFAKHNLAAWSGEKYYMVDAWSFRPPDIEVGLSDATRDDMNEPQESPHIARMEQARANTEQWSSRREMVREFSTVASLQFPVDDFDWVYVDALHTYEAVTRDLEAWYPLVKPGGLISGDDFVDASDAKMLEWNGNVPEHFSWGTRRAVTDFFRSVGVAIHVTYVYDCYMFPAWYALKPTAQEPGPNQVRLSKTKTHPLRCREELPALARELGLEGASAQIGDTSAPLISTRLSPAVAETPGIVEEEDERKSRFRASAVGRDGADSKAHLWGWLHLSSQGDHNTRAGVLVQLEYWWPRLRSGGMISGDDFVSGRDSRWTETSQPPPHLFVSLGWFKTAAARKLTPAHWDVEGAVNEFFAQRGVEVFVSYALYCHPYPSWYALKP